MENKIYTENKLFAEKWQLANDFLNQYQYSDRYQNLLAEIKPVEYDAKTKELVLQFATPVMQSLMGQKPFFLVMYAICQAFGLDTHLKRVSMDGSGNKTVKRMMNYHWNSEFKNFDRLQEKSNEEDRKLLSQVTPVMQHLALNIFRVPQHLMNNERLEKLFDEFYLQGAIYLKAEEEETALEKAWHQVKEEYATRCEWEMPKGLMQEIHPCQIENQSLHIKVDSYAAYTRLSQDTFLQYCIAKHFGCKFLLVKYLNRNQEGGVGLVEISWAKEGADRNEEKKVLQKIQETKDLMRRKISKQELLNDGETITWFKNMQDIFLLLTPEEVLKVLEDVDLIYGKSGKLWILKYKGQGLDADTYEWLIGVISSFFPNPTCRTVAVIQG